MKRLFCIAFLFVIGMGCALTSCNKDDDGQLEIQDPKTSPNDAQNETHNEEKEDVRYYVKYEVHSSYSDRISYTQTISFTTDIETKSITQNGYSMNVSWEATYGPFKKGNKVNLTVQNSLMDVHARIYVSRDNEPFVIKAESNNRGRASLSYTIDF